ncbi:hypothetical protein Poly51_30660 [Rubripirellula tenax]|uniref:Uncharacterized protein n=1 Tax=Rubripirellula tenax TaxID=2528015 RepID=A0A5C6F3I5_9BACT|nr:hypothetical protein Poly51_30660 [Rubripirellula tenax]
MTSKTQKANNRKLTPCVTIANTSDHLRNFRRVQFSKPYRYRIDIDYHDAGNHQQIICFVIVQVQRRFILGPAVIRMVVRMDWSTHDETGWRTPIFSEHGLPDESSHERFQGTARR